VTSDASNERGQHPRVCDVGENAAVGVGRIAWLATVFVALLTALALLLSGYDGYAGLGLAVAAAAAINLL
jgi:hypothetical protein